MRAALLAVPVFGLLGFAACGDDDEASAGGKANVRVIHASYDAPAVNSPDAPAVDVVVAGGDTPVFANTAFKEATAFRPVDGQTLTLEVKVNPMGTTVLTVPDVVLEAGKIYTIFAKGQVGDSTLGAELIVNQ